MKITDIGVFGVKVVEPRVFSDDRGCFFETWRENDFRREIFDCALVQDNQSSSRCGVLRGLHYQIRHPQGKLIRAVRGEIYDVAVDMRKSSPSFGASVGIALSAENRRMLWIPPWCAHGLLVLSPEADVVYRCRDYYHPEDERTVSWRDPDIGIQWPLPKGVLPALSARDEAAPVLSAAECYD